MQSKTERRVAAIRGLGALALAAATLALAGCGGAVEKAIGNLIDETKVSYSFSQSNVSCTVAEPADPCTDVELYATERSGIQNHPRPYWREVPTAGTTQFVIDHVYRDLQADGRWKITVGYNSSLPPGVYTGQIELNFLSFDLFTEWVPGKLNYRLEVRTGETAHLTTLPAELPGATDWSSIGGTPTRAGYVPVSLDPSKFNVRWTKYYGSTNLLALGSGPVLTRGQRIALPSLRPYGAAASGTDNMRVLNLADGTEVWQGSLARWPEQVIAVGDRLYWSGRQTSTSNMSIYATGRDSAAVLASKDFVNTSIDNAWIGTSTQLIVPSVPEINYLSALSLSDLSTTWTAVINDRVANTNYRAWGATVDEAAGIVYSNNGGYFRANRLSDGTALVQTEVPAREDSSFLTLPTYQAPLLASDGTSAVLLNFREAKEKEVVSNQLTVVDRSSGAIRWQVAGQFMDQPVEARGIVYVSNQQTRSVEARNLVDGTVIWSWPMDAADGFFQRQMVLTDTHLFVSTDKQTVAVDLTTHQVVWRTNAGGWIGLSREGVLVLLSTKLGGANPSVLKAFNLR